MTPTYLTVPEASARRRRFASTQLRLLALVTLVGVLVCIAAWVAGLVRSPRPDDPANRKGPETDSHSVSTDVSRSPSELTGASTADAVRTAIEPPALSTEPGAFALRVRSTAGAPIPGLSVLVESPAGAQELVTNEGGLAFSSISPPWRVLTRDEGFAPSRHVVHALGQSDAHEITVDRESMLLQGQCWLDGMMPDRPVELHLLPDSGTLFPDGELTDHERAFLGLARSGHELLRFRSNESGGFLIRGARLSEHVRVFATGLATMPGRQGIDSASGYLGKGIAVQLPEPDLQVYAYSSTHELRGRCVVLGSGLPAEGAGIVATVYPTPDSWDYVSTAVDSDGGFRLRVPVPRPFKVELTVGATLVSQPAKLTLTADDTAFPDLGTILVEPLRFAELRVENQEGSPLPTAKVVMNGAHLIANFDGRVHVPLPEESGPVSVTVSAWGYAPHTESLPLAEAITHVVRLKRANRLRITLTNTSDGRALPEYALRGSIADFGDPTQGSIGAPASADVTAGTVTLWADETGTIDLFGLPSGRALAAEVMDPFGHLLERVAIEPLGEQEERAIALSVRADPLEFSGLVTDSEGAPLAGVEVEVAAVGGKGQYGTTDLAGRFQVREFCGDSARITAGGAGWSEVTRQVAPIVNGQVVHVTLHPSTSLVVQFQASEPGELDKLEVWAHAPGTEATWHGSKAREGRWVIHGLPLGVVTVEANTEAAQARTEVDTRRTKEIALRLARKID